MVSLPDRLLHFHRQHRWLSHVVFWIVFLLIAVSNSKYRDGNRGTYGFEFASDALYMSAEMVYAYAMAYFVIPQLIYRKRYLLAVVGFLLSCYASSVIARILIVKICEPMAGIAPKAFETYAEILTDFPKLIYNYYLDMMATASAFVFLKILKDQVIAQKHTLLLEKEKAETELRLLKTQLNPHFLFNTLNNIYSLSLSSSPVTSPAIARLADILDYILYRCNTPSVPLRAEIALLNNYIGLERLRYDDRLTVNFKTNIAREAQVAPLILLSLVENAFKHGASDDTGAPIIDIELQVSGECLVFSVFNTVVKSDSPLQEQTTGERIGLNNLRRQLDLIYGEDYTFKVTDEEWYFKVELTINLKKEEAKHEKDPVLVG